MGDYRHLVRKWVKPEDLNPHGTLFGGRLLQWIDEEAAIVATAQLGTQSVVTRYISEIDFVSRAEQGDLLDLDFQVNTFGRTSLTLSCKVENAVTGTEVLRLDRIVFVTVDAGGHSVPHGQSEPTEGSERLRWKQRGAEPSA